MKYILLALLFTSAGIAQTSAQGSISGVIKDSQTGEAIIGANVVIKGTAIGSSTDIDGKYLIKNVEAGTYSLQVTFITYATLELNSVVVENGKQTSAGAQLTEETQELAAVIVSAEADKSFEVVLLLDRKKSVQIVETIGAQELSRKGISNAEGALTQVVGVSKQQGIKNVFVRGLGDRYNSTSLNGLPLPSEDPQYKNIALSFFSSDIIDNIGVSKTFTSNIYGDVAGASVNIVSKKLFAEQEFSISGSVSANSLVLSNDFYMADGNNFMGITDNRIPITNLNQYTFTNAFTPKKLSGTLINPNMSVSGGKSFDIGSSALKLFFVASMSGDFNYNEGHVRQTNTEGKFRQDLAFQKYEYNATQFALSNISFLFGNNNSIGYNLIFIHDNKQSIGNYTGFSISAVDDITDPNAYDALIRRQQTNNNTLVVNQLTSELLLTDKLSLDLRGSFNAIQGDEPDRRTNFLIGNGSGEKFIANNSSPAYNHRFFSTLKENEMAATAELAYSLFNNGSKIVVGYNYRNTARDFSYVQFNFDHQGNQEVDPENPDLFYNQRSLNFGYFDLESSRGTGSRALSPFFYTGLRQVNSGFFHFVYEINPSFSVIVGSRFENFYQKVMWSVGADEIRPDIPSDNTSIRNKNYFLPSLNMKYLLSEDNQLRFSASRTFTFPQFKEAAPFLYEDVSQNTFGNPDLIPAQNLNLDLKFEHYFSGGGLIAFSGYYKYIKGSINRILANSAALEMSYFNTGDANVVGAELEFRKKLIDFRKLNPSSVSTGMNVAYLYAVQELINNPESGVQFTPTDKRSGLEGASPLLINTDLTFTQTGRKGNKSTAAVVLNYFSSRIYSLGVSGQNNVYERGVPTLDFISKFELSEKLTLSVSFKNLLNPQYRLTKEILTTGVDDVLSVYKRGVTSSVGFAYKF